MRLLMLVIGILMPASAAFAKAAFGPGPAGNSVTILSDALSEPEGEASQIVQNLSILLDKEGELRALIINDYGGPANIKDLLQLKGTDFAIVHNDTLAYLGLNKTLPDAPRKVRMLAPLFNQRVLLLAKGDFDSITSLKGHRVATQAARPSRGVTAKTIFGLLKIDTQIIEFDEESCSKGSLATADAVLVFEQDWPHLQAWGITPGLFHIVAIPATGSLAQVYQPAKLPRPQAGDALAGEEKDTVQVTSVLAAFDWNSGHVRYSNAASFATKFYQLLPELRARSAALRKTDVKASVPGWQRLDLAVPLAAAAGPPDESKRSVPGTAGATPLKLLAIARPPLTDPQQKNGGVVLKLLTDALAASGTPVTVEWVPNQKSLLDGLTGTKPADAGLFAQTVDCDILQDPSSTDAALCGQVILSDPLIKVAIAVFTRFDMPSKAIASKGGLSRTFCIPETQTIPHRALSSFTCNDLSSVAWTTAKVVTLRPKTLIECFAAVDNGEADALLAIEPEGRYIAERLKLSNTIQNIQHLEASTGIHAIIAKSNPRQAEIQKAIGDAIVKLKSIGGYAAAMASQRAGPAGAPFAQP